MKCIDLHVHTTFSDGTLTPAQVAELAAASGVSAIAVTDHDNAGGFSEAEAAGRKLGVEVVPGIEISTRYDCAVHILGYYIDPDSPAAASVLTWVIAERDERNEKICRLMQADGIGPSYEEMKQRFGPTIGRPHFAEILMDCGLASDISDAFDRYLKRGCRYYVGRKTLSLEQSISLILSAGGVPVLAHPFQYNKTDSELRELIRFCMEHGLSGMECRYSLYDGAMSEYLEKLADEYGLIKTGGSDFHGEHKPHIRLGTGTDTNRLAVPYEWLEILKSKGRYNK